MSDIKKIKAFHKDGRGVMSYLSDGDFIITDVLLISSKKSSIRANHYHRIDTHAIALLSGKLEYITKDMRKEKSPIEKRIVKSGYIIVTPPFIAHKVRFLEDSFFVVLTTEPRDQKHYENDTVRLEVEDTK